MYDTHDDALAPGAAFSADDSKAAAPDAAHGTRSLDTDDLSDAANAYPLLPYGATAGAVAFSGDGKYVARAAATGSTPDGSRLFAVTTTWPAASSGRTSSGRQRCTTTPGDLTTAPPRTSPTPCPAGPAPCSRAYGPTGQAQARAPCHVWGARAGPSRRDRPATGGETSPPCTPAPASLPPECRRPTPHGGHYVQRGAGTPRHGRERKVAGNPPM